MTRYVALDLETTNLDPRLAFPLEIAAVTYDPDPNTTPDTPTDPYGLTTCFVPHHPRTIVHEAEPVALAVNRYYERRLFEQMSDAPETARQIDALIRQLDGATIVGANPAYDAAILWRYLSTFADLTSPPWHFRLYDVEVATRAHLGLEYTPSLAQCLDLYHLGTIEGAHTPIGDAFAALDVFHAIESSR